MKYCVYLVKHFTKCTMRYGIYDTLQDAANAMKYAQSVNTIDNWYIQHDAKCNCYDCLPASVRI